MRGLDLNADLGEGIGDNEAMLGIVSSASIACGGHAGDEATMRAAIKAATARDVVIGAHPGFADRANFGRTRMQLPAGELAALVRGQVEALRAIADEEAATVRYIKLHGALANMAAEDVDVALAALGGCVGSGLAVLAIDNSAQVDAAARLGMTVIREAYADRGYQPGGLLQPRAEPGAVLHDATAIAARAMRLAERGEIVAADGGIIRTGARSLCIHGDNPDAVAIARAVAAALEDAGIAIRSPLAVAP